MKRGLLQIQHIIHRASIVSRKNGLDEERFATDNLRDECHIPFIRRKNGLDEERFATHARASDGTSGPTVGKMASMKRGLLLIPGVPIQLLHESVGKMASMKRGLLHIPDVALSGEVHGRKNGLDEERFATEPVHPLTHHHHYVGKMASMKRGLLLYFPNTKRPAQIERAFGLSQSLNPWRNSVPAAL